MTAAELKTLRLRLGRTQAEMAASIGISLRTYGRYERGVRVIPAPVVKAVLWVAGRV